MNLGFEENLNLPIATENKNEFFVYHVPSDTWITQVLPVPYPPIATGLKNELYYYNVKTNQWEIQDQNQPTETIKAESQLDLEENKNDGEETTKPSRRTTRRKDQLEQQKEDARIGLLKLTDDFLKVCHRNQDSEGHLDVDKCKRGANLIYVKFCRSSRLAPEVKKEIAEDYLTHVIENLKLTPNQVHYVKTYGMTEHLVDLMESMKRLSDAPDFQK